MNRIIQISLFAVAGLFVVGSLSAGVPFSWTPVSQSTESQQPTAKLVSADQAGLEVATLKVSNMYCAACPTIVRKSLEDVDGVVKADVSYRTKQAIVTYDSTKSTATMLAVAVSELGYPTIVIK